MSDDALLKRLADRARAQAQEEPRVLAQALAAEPLRSPAGSARPVDPTDPEDHLVEELLAPLSAELRARISDDAHAALLGQGDHPDDPGMRVAGAPVAIPRLAPHARRKRPWRLSIAAGSVALAASFLLLVLIRRTPDLPAYSLEIGGAVDTVRGEPTAASDAPVELQPGADLTVILRPEQKPTGPLAARAFWVRGACIRVWNALTEISDTGGIRLSGVAEAPCGAGAGELVVIIGRHGSLPDTPAVQRGTVRVSRAVRWR